MTNWDRTHPAELKVIKDRWQNSPNGQVFRKNYRDENKDHTQGEQLRARLKLRASVLLKYAQGNHPGCINCGVSELAVLTLDHINCNGSKERNGMGGGEYYRKLLKEPIDPTLRILCFNCNWKHVMYGSNFMSFNCEFPVEYYQDILNGEKNGNTQP